ncbi:MAG: cupin domain-containing protein [Pyrinomonadaceae bacterium]
MEKELEMMAEQDAIICDNLDESIEQHKDLGYRLDMIFPADSPREALLSKGVESLRIKAVPPALAGGSTHVLETSNLTAQPPAIAGGTAPEWTVGRAGMEYRDLIPGRLGGKVIASHIRLPFGGAVPDSVHYHKVDFQMIYCVRGRIQVVYEDQGPPFWLESGDCILQPPEIRHRVLYSEAGAEVIEVSSPAEHETWIDHEMTLPNGNVDPERDFGGQRYYRFKNSGSEPYVGSGYSQSQTDIWEMSDRKLAILIKSFVNRDNNSRSRGWFIRVGIFELAYVLSGELSIVDAKGLANSFEPGRRFRKGDCIMLPEHTAFTFDWSPDLKLLDIIIAT